MAEIVIRDLKPGTVIELPNQYLGQKIGIYMGAELKAKYIHPNVSVFEKGQFVNMPLGDVPVTEKFKIAPLDQAAQVIKEVKVKSQEETLSFPHLGLTSGTDPEIFVLDEKDQVIPAWEFLPEEEKAKGSVGKNYYSSYSFWDGYQAEFAPFAGHCLEGLGDNIRNGLSSILIRAQAKNPKSKLTLTNAVKLTNEALKAASDEQIRFRCSASYNVYQDMSDPPPDPRAYPYRFAGGHIHIGRRVSLPAPIITEIVKGLDSILGVAGVSLAEGIDVADRRTMYGRAGEFRLPKHGIEYRVLSNFWLSHPAIYHLVFELMRLTVRMANSGLVTTCWDAKEEETRAVINSNDVKGAREILTRNIHVLYCMFRNVWGNGHITKAAVTTLMNGIGAAIKEPTNIEYNWDLGGGRWKSMGKHKGGCWASQAQSLKGALSVKV